MTSKEFVIWLKGFSKAANSYNITPKQWDEIQEELEKVSDEQKIGTPIGQGGWGTPNGIITATPGYGSITYNPSTSTTYSYPSGSAWHYTNGGNEIKD
jgi:hypothetical protein